jgi:Family of unknown function (DUF6527)
MTIKVTNKLGITQEAGSHFGLTYLHWCPGCDGPHAINVEKPNHCNAKWSFDGNVESPTFSPSINYVGMCHYFIRGGRIEFCSDSKHALAGQTVELPDFPSDWFTE